MACERRIPSIRPRSLAASLTRSLDRLPKRGVRACVVDLEREDEGRGGGGGGGVVVGRGEG